VASKLASKLASKFGAAALIVHRQINGSELKEVIMSRAGSGDVVFVKPRSSVYTALAAGGTVAVLVGLIVLYMQALSLGVKFF
jgi:hypothetical protein